MIGLLRVTKLADFGARRASRGEERTGTLSKEGDSRVAEMTTQTGPNTKRTGFDKGLSWGNAKKIANAGTNSVGRSIRHVPGEEPAEIHHAPFSRRQREHKKGRPKIGDSKASSKKAKEGEEQTLGTCIECPPKTYRVIRAGALRRN